MAGCTSKKFAKGGMVTGKSAAPMMKAKGGMVSKVKPPGGRGTKTCKVC